MAITREQFEVLVARLEEKARKNPVAYRLRVIALACVGYGYLALVLWLLFVLFLVTLASVVYLKAVALKIAIPLGAFLWLSAKALWVRLDPPQGRRVRRGDAPALFALIDELRRTLRSSRFHRVLVTDDFNASVTQIPRLGIFGLHRNYLTVGLPLMKFMTTEQFKAVLAHEFGHLAGGHGRFSNWIYRLRISWARLLHVLESRKSWGSFLFKPFFERYAPYFNAYSFPLARANEYEADRAAARLTSPRALAESLTASNVIGSYLGERYWPGIQRKADELPQPSFSPFSGMAQGMASGIEESAASEWVERAMARKTGVDDTHPALPDRLAAIGETPHLGLPAPGQSADRLLGAALPGITEEFDRRWREAIQPSWQKRHREVQESRARLAELEKRAASGAQLTLDETYSRAKLTEEHGAGHDAALEQFRALYARWPEEPVAWIALGRRLLLRDDESGFAMVERAMQKDEQFIVAGCEVLRDYCWRKGRKEQAHAWHARMVERARTLEAARAERSQVTLKDKFERHGLPDDVIEGLRRQLAAVQGLKKAYLVRKLVYNLPQQPCYVLGHVARGFLWNRKKAIADVQRQIVEKVLFPVQVLVMSVEGVNYRFGRKLRFMRGSRIF
jgi:Zn-dependent protease with chaperone function